MKLLGIDKVLISYWDLSEIGSGERSAGFVSTFRPCWSRGDAVSATCNLLTSRCFRITSGLSCRIHVLLRLRRGTVSIVIGAPVACKRSRRKFNRGLGLRTNRFGGL